MFLSSRLFRPHPSHLHTYVPTLQCDTACWWHQRLSSWNGADTQAKWSVKTQHSALVSSPLVVPVLEREAKDSRLVANGTIRSKKHKLRLQVEGRKNEEQAR